MLTSSSKQLIMNSVHMNIVGGITLSRIIENPKQLILSKAKEILYNEGYSKLSMRTLSRACDIALGTIYNYYPTKQELIIEMMTEYWQNYLDSVQNIANSNADFYIKLNNIFNELRVFIESFRQFWLTPQLYDSPEYVKGGLRKEDMFMEKFIIIFKEILEKEHTANNIHVKLGAYETANFIIMNFITMVQMPFFKYSSFELVLKELLK